MNNFTKVSVAHDARTELHDKLSLTGAEISVNNLPAGAGVPFVHSHKKNEEIYIILSGKGKAVIDDETVTIYLVNPKAPCFIRDDEENYTYLILPVNINQNQGR